MKPKLLVIDREKLEGLKKSEGTLIVAEGEKFADGVMFAFQEVLVHSKEISVEDIKQLIKKYIRTNYGVEHRLAQKIFTMMQSGGGGG